MPSPPDTPFPFARRPGCPLCGIVATPYPRGSSDASALDPGASSSDVHGGDGGPGSAPPSSASTVGYRPYLPLRRDSASPVSSSNNNGLGYGGVPINATTHSSSTNVIVYKDANITAYIEKKFPVSSKGHIIIVPNLHVPNIYILSPNDLPLLNHIQTTATHLLHSLNPPTTPSSPTPGPRTTAEEAISNRAPLKPSEDPPYHIGFISPPFKDNKIPITDHLHVHAYIGKPDLAGWWRGVAYSGLAWYSIQDLIAEIRESVSNNRVKSGYANRTSAPIDMVPSAGAVYGTPDGRQEQYLPLPLQVNKTHISPLATNMNAGSSSSLLGGGSSSGGSSTAVNRGVTPSLTSDAGMEMFDQGDSAIAEGSGRHGAGGIVAVASVDLGSFRRSGDEDDEYEPGTATRSHFGLMESTSSAPGPGRAGRPGSGAHKPRESFDEAAWEGMDGTPSGDSEEGQAGPGPSTIRALSATAAGAGTVSPPVL